METHHKPLGRSQTILMYFKSHESEFPCRSLAHTILDNSELQGVHMQLSPSRHPTTLWWFARMWRAKDTCRQTSTYSLKSLQLPSAGHRRIEDRFQEEEFLTWRSRLASGPGLGNTGIATLNMIFSVTNSNRLGSILIVNRNVVSPTLNVNPTFFDIPCKNF